jgi:hypothetical protein
MPVEARRKPVDGLPDTIDRIDRIDRMPDGKCINCPQQTPAERRECLVGGGRRPRLGRSTPACTPAL